jgi:hypothetical protein
MRLPWLRQLMRRPAPKVVRPRSRWRLYQPWLERLEDRLAPATNITFDAALTHALSIKIGGANETATLSVSGTNLSVSSNQGTTSDGSLGFLAATPANSANVGSIAAANDVRQIIVTGAAGTQTVVLQGGTFTALTINDGTIENVTFNTAPSTFAEISANATNANLAISATNVLTLNQNLTTQNGGSMALAAINAISLTNDVLLDTTGTGTTPAGAAITLGTVSGGGHALNLSAGTGGVITGNGPVDNVSTLTITNSGGTTFKGNIGAGSAGAVSLNDTTGTITFQGTTTKITTLTTASAGYNVALASTTTTVTAAATFLNTGAVTLGGAAADKVTFSGGLTVNGAAVTAALGTVNTGDLSVAAGSFSASAGTVNAVNLSLSGGTLQLGPPGPFNVAGNWSRTGGTFTPGTGTVTFTRASGTQTLDSGGAGGTFASINHSGAGTLQLTGNALSVSAALTNTGTLDLNGQNLNVAGTVSNPGTVQLQGSESVALTNDTTQGTWVYYGNTTAGPLSIQVPSYFNLTINDQHATPATFQAGSAITVAGAMTVTAGTYDANGNTTSVTGATTINGGTYLASSSQQTLSGGLAVSSGTFTGSTGTVSVGDVGLTGGTLTAPSGPFNVAGNWSQSGGTFTPGSGTVSFTRGSGTQTLDSGSTAFASINHTGAGTLQLVNNGLALGGTLGNVGTFDLNGQSLDATGTVTNTGTVALQGTETVMLVSGNDTAEGTWLYYGDSTAGPITMPVSSYFNLTFTDQHATKATFEPGSALSVAGALDIEAGTLDLNGNDLSVAGTVTNKDTVRLQGLETVSLTNDTTEGTWVYYGDSTGASLTLPVTSYFNLIISDQHAAPDTFQAGSGISVAGAMTVTAGTYDANGNTTGVTGATTINGGTYLASSAQQTLDGGLSVSSGAFTGSTGAVSTAAVSLSGGTLTAPSSTFDVSGDFSNGGGTFDANGGTVDLDGTGQTLSGLTTFNNLSKTVAAADTLTFTAGASDLTTVSGLLTLTGTSGHLLSLRSTTAGTQWQVDPADSSVSFVDVKDSDNIDATAISATNSVDAGNNTNWAIINGAGAVSYTSKGKNVTLRKNGANLEIRDNANKVVGKYLLTTVKSVTIQGADKTSNQLIIDYTAGGTFIISNGITFKGGALPGSTNSLTITGGAFNTDTYSYTGPHSGTVQLGTGGQLISYTNLAPLTNTGTANDIVFNLPAGKDGAALQDDGTAGNGMSQLASTNASFEMTTFTDPTNSLTINGSGGGNGTITTSADFSGDFTAGLAVSGATDAVTLNALSLTTGTGALSVTVSTIAINGGTVKTGDGQSYTGAVTLGAGTTLTAGGTATFGSTVAGGGNSLAISGNAIFDGAVSGLSTLSVSGTTGINTATITSTGNQSYTGAVTLGTGTTLTTGTSATLGSTITGGGNSLAVSGNAFFGGAVTGLSTLSVSGTTAINTSTITSTGAQGYTGAVTLGTGATLTTGGTATLSSTVSGGGNSLAVSGNAVFGGAVTGVSTLSVSGTTAINTTTITSSGNQTYSSAVTLGTGTALTTGTSATLASTVGGGGNSLAVNGNAIFDGAVTGLTTLSVSGTTAINTATISSSGAQTYSGAVALGSGATLTTGSTASFGSTIAGGGNSLAVSGNAALNGAVTGLSTLSISGTTAINTTTITSSGAQGYSGAVTLGTGTTLTTGTTVTLGSTVSGAGKSLAVSGNAVFDGAVTSLSTLSVSGTTAINTASITSTGNQLYTGAVTLGAGATLTTGGTATFGSPLDGGGNSLAVSGNAVFNGAVTGLSTLSVSGTTAINTATISSSGGQTYSGAVTLGAGTTLTSITATLGSTVSGGGNSLAVSGNAIFAGAVTGLSTLSVSGTTAINTTTITSTGGQGYSGAVTLGTGTTLTSGTTVTLGSTVSGGGNSLAISGNAVFDGAVTGLSTLSVSGTTVINAPTISSTADQSYTGAVILQTGTTLTTATTATLGSKVSGGGNSLAVSGNAVFDGAVSGLSTLSVSGSTAINTPSITTTSDQSYGGAVTLQTSATLSGGTITLGSTVTGAGNSLSIAGNAVFNGAVSGLSALSVSGATTVNTASLTTTGDQSYGGAVTLQTGTTLSGGTMRLGSTVTGGGNSLSISGNAIFNGAVTGLSTLSVSGTTAINTAAITTTSTQSYGGAVTLGTSTTLAATTATLGSTVTGGGNSLSISGNASFNGAVAGVSTLSVSGATAINTSTITTSGAQSYSAAVTLGADPTLTSSGNSTTGNITIGGTLSLGGHNLTIYNRGTTSTVGGAITGPGGLILQGGGILTLPTGQSDTQTTTTINGGILIANAALSGPVSLQDAKQTNETGHVTATLAGEGSVNGIAAGATGGILIPGPLSRNMPAGSQIYQPSTPPANGGKLTSTASVVLNPKVTFEFRLNGKGGNPGQAPVRPVAGTDYDQLVVSSGSFTAGGAILQAGVDTGSQPGLGTASFVDDAFVIVKAGAVSGTAFSPASFALRGQQFPVVYGGAETSPGSGAVGDKGPTAGSNVIVWHKDTQPSFTPLKLTKRDASTYTSSDAVGGNTIVETDTAEVQVTFTDPDELDAPKGTISWFQGDPAHPLTLTTVPIFPTGNDSYGVLGTKEYDAPAFATIKAVANDGHLSPVISQFLLTVVDAPLRNGTPKPIGPGNATGVSKALLATFTADAYTVNPASSFDVFVKWDDNTSSDSLVNPGSVWVQSDGHGNYSVYGTHTYGAPGRFMPTITVTANGLGLFSPRPGHSALVDPKTGKPITSVIYIGNPGQSAEFVAGDLFHDLFKSAASGDLLALARARGIDINGSAFQSAALQAVIQQVVFGTQPIATDQFGRPMSGLRAIVDQLCQQLNVPIPPLNPSPTDLARENAYIQFLAHGGTRQLLALTIVTSPQYLGRFGNSPTAWVKAVVNEYINGLGDGVSVTGLVGVNPVPLENYWASLVPVLGYQGVAKAIFGYADLSNLAEVEYMFFTFQHLVPPINYAFWVMRLHQTNENQVIREFIASVGANVALTSGADFRGAFSVPTSAFPLLK